MVHEEEPFSDQALAVVESLQPFVAAEALVQVWPGTVSEESVRRYLYPVHDLVLRRITEAADGLYDWQQPALPEDLFFLEGNDVRLGSVAHERQAFVRLPQGNSTSSLVAEVPELANVLKPAGPDGPMEGPYPSGD